MSVINSIYLFSKNSFGGIDILTNKFEGKVIESGIQASFYNDSFKLDEEWGCYCNVLNIDGETISEPLNFEVRCYFDESLIFLVTLESDYSSTPILMGEYDIDLLLKHLKFIFGADEIDFAADDDRNVKEVYKFFKDK
ncbi:hypothetical protein [Flammeovirga sp. SJP92]|uniref:hypothetical protein n=1 Tax=Flammeovirga sp. SJP92 TaxID=1775430 RepID=UPI0012FAE665|nr:hypothetical protein [Flammeovirga sp. SJP92]